MVYLSAVGRSIATGTLIGATELLFNATSVKIYTACGGESEYRDFNPETDEGRISKIALSAIKYILTSSTYTYVLFREGREAADEFRAQINLIDTSPNAPEQSNPDEEGCSDEDSEPLSSVLLSDVVCSTAEELIFRGGMQPLLAKILSVCLPILGKTTYIGIPLPNLISVVATAALFGAAHYEDFTKGGAAACTSISIGGCIYGLAKERYGLLCAVAAHITHNGLGHCLEKYIPVMVKYLKGIDGEIENKKKQLEWNSAFLECLKKGEVSFDQSLWKGDNITSDIRDDFYCIAKSITTLPEEVKEKIALRKYSFTGIKSIVEKNGYTGKEEITAKLIDFYSKENQDLEKEILELERKKA